MSILEAKEIQIQIKLVKNPNELNNLEKVHQGMQFTELCDLLPIDDSGWTGLWKKKHAIEMAGISMDEVIAIVGMAGIGSEYKVHPREFAEFIKKFLTEVFGRKNLLSCVVFASPQKEVYSHFLVYPLNGRQLNPEQWIDSRSRQLSHKIRMDFTHQISDKFGIDVKRESKGGNGHTEYLDNFPKITLSKEEEQETFYNTVTEASQTQTDYPKDKIRAIINTTIKYFTTGVDKGDFLKLNGGDITVSQYLDEVRKYLKRMYPDMSERDMKLIVKSVESAATGFYILDDLINDPKISDIKIVSPWKIRVKVEGERRTSNLKFIDAEDYYRFLDGVMLRYHRSGDKQIHVFTDKDSNPDYILRNNITLNEINSEFPNYHIRKVPKTKYTIDRLIDLGVMDETVANYLIWAAKAAKGVVFTGKGSSGKTTMMNTLLEYTPANASGLVIQESEELFSNRPEMTFEHITEQYDLKALAKNGLLTDIDYFIIGEVKGEEAMYFINACDTGNKAWCSVHSPNSKEAISKLADYVMYASKYNRKEALYMLKELQVVVFMKNFKVAEISEVIGWDAEKEDLKYRTVFRRDDLVEQKLE